MRIEQAHCYCCCQNRNPATTAAIEKRKSQTNSNNNRNNNKTSSKNSQHQVEKSKAVNSVRPNAASCESDRETGCGPSSVRPTRPQLLISRRGGWMGVVVAVVNIYLGGIRAREGGTAWQHCL